MNAVHNAAWVFLASVEGKKQRLYQHKEDDEKHLGIARTSMQHAASVYELTQGRFVRPEFELTRGRCVRPKLELTRGRCVCPDFDRFGLLVYALEYGLVVFVHRVAPVRHSGGGGGYR